GRRARIVEVARGGADCVWVAAGRQGGAVLPCPRQGAPVDGAGRALAAGVRRRGAAAAGGRWVGGLPPVAQSRRRRPLRGSRRGPPRRFLEVRSSPRQAGQLSGGVRPPRKGSTS